MTINKDFRQKTDQELINIVKKLRIKLLEYRFKAASGEFDKFHQVRFAKKSLAQALTILRERNVKIDHLQLEKLENLKKAKSIFSAKKDDEKPSSSKESKPATKQDSKDDNKEDNKKNGDK